MNYSDFQCLKCGAGFEPAFFASAAPPSGGVIFTSHGNYGSTVYDPLPSDRGGYIAIVVCDRCLRGEGGSGNVMKVTPQAAPDPEMTRWDPDEPQGY